MLIVINMLLIDLFKLFWLYQSIINWSLCVFWLHWHKQNNLVWSIGKKKFMIGFSFSSIGQCIITRIQRRILNPVRYLRSIFSQKYLIILLLRYLLLHHLRCLTEFWIHLWNMPILFILFRISLWQWYGLKVFTEDLNGYQSSFLECFSVIGLSNVGLLLNYIKKFYLYFHYFKKVWDLDFFSTFF